MEKEILVLMVLSPSAEIIKDVQQIKTDVGKVIGDFDTIRSKAHITIRPFPYRSRRQIVSFLNGLEDLLKQLPPIHLMTDGFEGYPANGLIFIKIAQDDYVKRWFELLNDKVLNERKIMPHITIANGLAADEFEKVWSLLKGRPYQREFLVNHLLVLDRDLHTGQCTPIKKIYFCNPEKELKPALNLFNTLPALFPLTSPTIFS